jgi:flagella basal body P-ring formation protein FlgA
MMLPRLLVLGFCALAVPAIAQTAEGIQSTPKFKRSVTVASDVVRIGDLVDGAGAVADVAIFRAPDPGATGSVGAARVLDALRRNNILIVDTDGLSAIEVKRASRVLAARDIEARIVRAIGSQFGFSEHANYAATFDGGVRLLHLDPADVADLQVARSYYDPRTSRFDVTFAVPGNARVSSLRYTGTLTETTETAVLTRPINRGETIRSSDFVVERRPKSDVVADAAGAGEVAGMAARQTLRAGQPIRRGDLAKPETVKRDEIVTLIFEMPGIMLTARGKALEAGTEGDVISVLNVQSKRTVQGTVTGPGRVSIMTVTPAVAETAAVYTPPAPVSTE